jgi:ketosteroid isomerase-like protein
MASASDNLATTRRYLQAIESGATGDALAAFFAPDVVQEEFPNRLKPQGGRADLAAMLAASLRGKALMASQRYEVLNAVCSGDAVALEVQWSGKLAVPVAGLPSSGEMRARCAMFLEFRDGKIIRQRNYDCFEPW